MEIDDCFVGREDYAVIKDLISRISYKQGWRILADEITAFLVPEDYAIRVTVEYLAPDSYDPGTIRKQRFTALLSGMIGMDSASREERWKLWLFSLLLFLECHEAAEFFTLDGKRIYDPHASKPDSARGRIPLNVWRP